MHIKRATPDDASVLTDIAFAAKRHWCYPETWFESWRDLLTIKPEFIAGHETYVATLEQRPVGFYSVERKNDTLELSHLWVLPDLMGRGVGRSLFNHAVDCARELGFQQLEIESDPNAEGFYLRMGARRVGSRTTNMEHGPRELPILVYELQRLPKHE